MGNDECHSMVVSAMSSELSITMLVILRSFIDGGAIPLSISITQYAYMSFTETDNVNANTCN